MATTTFSGPVKAGTIKDTTGSTVGTDVANVGFALMAQSAVIDIAGATYKPSANQVVVTTANDDGTASTVAVGTSADADAFIPATSVQAVGTTRGTLDTEATDVGTTDLQVLADFTATDGDGTAGVATVTILYIQNNNLS
jgi:hypothetical protein